MKKNNMEKLPPFSSKKFKIVFVIVSIIVVWKIFFYVEDEIKIKEIQRQVNWIEQFYTDNDRYPNVNEFYSRYQDKKRVYSQTANYAVYDHTGRSDYNDAQNFSLRYSLHNENRPNALGQKINYDMFGGYHYTKITPCKRWEKIINPLSIPQASYAVKSEMGNFYYNLVADFEKGTVAIVANNVPKIILKDLKHPRFLSPKKDLGYPENSVLITNGKDIMKYTWSEAGGGTLTNPTKMADVPTICPVI